MESPNFELNLVACAGTFTKPLILGIKKGIAVFRLETYIDCVHTASSCSRVPISRLCVSETLQLQTYHSGLHPKQMLAIDETSWATQDVDHSREGINYPVK